MLLQVVPHHAALSDPHPGNWLICQDGLWWGGCLVCCCLPMWDVHMSAHVSSKNHNSLPRCSFVPSTGIYWQAGFSCSLSGCGNQQKKRQKSSFLKNTDRFLLTHPNPWPSHRHSLGSFFHPRACVSSQTPKTLKLGNLEIVVHWASGFVFFL